MVLMELTMDLRGMMALGTFGAHRSRVCVLISGQKQVTVHLVGDDPIYLKIPKGFLEFVLVV